MRGAFGRFVRDDGGATAIEYGLIAGLVAIAIIAAMSAFGVSLQNLFGRVQTTAGDALDNAGI